MSGASTPALRLEHVDAGYDDQLVLRDISITVQPGTSVGVIGPNGAGKSTLFRVALGTMRPWRGAVEIFGAPAHHLDRRRQPVAYVPQARRLDRTFPVTARDVVAMGRVGPLGLLRFPRAADHAAVAGALDQVGLTHKAHRPFGALSGGEQQRLLVARALASNARLLLLDEPVTGVDMATQAEINRVVDRLVTGGGAVVTSTHDLSAENLARFDWLVCLNGEVIAQGPPATISTPDLWRRLFDGRDIGERGA